MMEKERKFNMAATKLREDHEHCALQAFFHHNRALIKASQAEVDSIARLSLSGEAYGYVQPLPWRPALALSTPGNDPAATTRNFACRTDVVQTVDMPNLAAVALITPSHISVVDAESLQLRYEVQLDWLTHIIGISSIQEKMRTADWCEYMGPRSLSVDRVAHSCGHHKRGILGCLRPSISELCPTALSVALAHNCCWRVCAGVCVPQLTH